MPFCQMFYSAEEILVFQAPKIGNKIESVSCEYLYPLPPKFARICQIFPDKTYPLSIFPNHRIFTVRVHLKALQVDLA